jgi:hypothetical protein
MADAVCGALYNASNNAEEFAYDYGESVDTLIDVSGSSETMTRQQITVDFEEALKQIKDPLNNNNRSPQNKLPFTTFGQGSNTPSYSDIVALSEGILLF